MAAMWGLLVCVLVVWITKGSSVPIGGTDERLENGQQRRVRASPNDISIKKALALLQSMETMLEHNTNDVQLETNEVEAEASVGHLKLVQQIKPKDDKPMTSGNVTSVTTAAPSMDQGHNATTAAPSMDQGRNATTAAPSMDQGRNATTAAPSMDQGRNATTAAPSMDQGRSTETSPEGGAATVEKVGEVENPEPSDSDGDI
ncbi:polysialoglycoprotein-like isoform X2 [Plectropomus leopardus]|uniref:polysialoglycoprotein-like isoform X2 n=1 Tax=Plectropomus leopardus TaxID=160734 RepID=UPI001C4CCB06|nr:polysialoglycoprotein-like isoform X2 [Plectropomus leopardus]